MSQFLWSKCLGVHFLHSVILPIPHDTGVGMDVSLFSVLSGVAPITEFVFVAVSMDELVENDQENTSFLVRNQGEWQAYEHSALWTAIGMATIKPDGEDRIIVAVSPLGEFWELYPRTIEEFDGRIEPTPAPLRGLSAVDDSIYAFGMGRVVLRRNSTDDWTGIGPGTTEADKGEVVGFEDMCGFSSDEIYAVGWGGEIWVRTEGQWSQKDSPTSGNLNAVHCADDGNVYIVGDKGVMIRGRGDDWEIVATERKENLTDVVLHNETLFVSTDFHILKMGEDGLEPETEFTDDLMPATCHSLYVAQDGLVSMGTKDLTRLVDGSWERIV
jgi:hypothetical protein